MSKGSTSKQRSFNNFQGEWENQEFRQGCVCVCACVISDSHNTLQFSIYWLQFSNEKCSIDHPSLYVATLMGGWLTLNFTTDMKCKNGEQKNIASLLAIDM